jgi:D-amino-acid dehydrogenase
VKTLILGGGIAGVTTAYYHGRDGHDVTLLEANAGLGLEATNGNAGIVAPGHSFAWGSPKAPAMLWRSLLGQETSIRMRLKPDLQLYLWGLKFLRECTAARARHNTLIKLRLCQYSQRLLDDVAHVEGIDYQAVRRGALYLYRDPALFQAGIQKMKLLGDHGQKQEILDGAGVARLEPAFEPVQARIAGAIRDVGDSSGDSRIFTEHLARICRDKFGATFETGVRVKALRAERDRVRAVVTDRGERSADLYVLALGVDAPIVARSLGIRLAVYPAKGYSSTFPIKAGGLAPSVPLRMKSPPRPRNCSCISFRMPTACGTSGTTCTQVRCPPTMWKPRTAALSRIARVTLGETTPSQAFTSVDVASTPPSSS